MHRAAICGQVASYLLVSCSGLVKQYTSSALYCHVCCCLRMVLLTPGLWELVNAGQFDAQDGPGSVEAWTTNLDWPGRQKFFQAKRHIWRFGQDTFLDPLAVCSESGCGTGGPQAESNGVRLQQPKAGINAESVTKRVQPVAGFWKHHEALTTVVLKDAGHMVPRDQPLVSQAMIEAWVQHCLDHTQKGKSLPQPDSLEPV